MECIFINKSVIQNSEIHYNGYAISYNNSNMIIGKMNETLSNTCENSYNRDALNKSNNRIDFVLQLPREICQQIFSYLDIGTLTKASIINKAWYSLSRDNWFYMKLFKTARWVKYAYSQSTSGCNSKCYKCLENEVKCFVSEKTVFCGNDNQLDILSVNVSVVHCVVFSEQRIISGSADSTIKVWNLHTNAQWSVQTLHGHSEAVRCLQLLHCPDSPVNSTRSKLSNTNEDLYFGLKCPRDVYLVSGSNDKTIKIWALAARNDWSSIICRATLTGHLNSVRCLQADHDKIVSGSYDGSLKVWCMATGKLIRTLRGHQDAILCVQYDDSVIVSGSLDKTIKVWLFDGECLFTLHGHVDPVACLHLDYKHNRIISGSHDNTLKFWDIRNKKCIRTIDWIESEGHKRVVRCLQADDHKFISGSDDKTIKVWDIENGTRLRTYQGHKDGVSCLQFNNEMLVSGSYDHSVILWDFSAC